MTSFWRSWLAFDERLSGTRPDSMRTAALSAMAGGSIRALYILERLYESRSASLVFLRSDAEFASIRTHPRFLRIVERMRFPGQ